MSHILKCCSPASSGWIGGYWIHLPDVLCFPIRCINHTMPPNFCKDSHDNFHHADVGVATLTNTSPIMKMHMCASFQGLAPCYEIRQKNMLPQIHSSAHNDVFYMNWCYRPVVNCCIVIIIDSTFTNESLQIGTVKK